MPRLQPLTQATR